MTTTHGALRRLDIQDTNLLRTALPTVLTLLIDRLGDVPEKNQQLARDCLAIAWRSSPTEVEGAIKQLGFGHRISRVREQSIRWTAKSALDKTSKLNFRTFTSYLIVALEDADGTVREASKQTIVELFLTVPPHARADLRREMSIHNVRKSTMQQIVAQLDMPDGPEINLSQSTSSIPEEVQARTNRRIITPTSHAEGSIAGSIASTYIGSVPGSEMEAMEAATVYSARDFEQELADMLPCFEGRESEKNWLKREKSLNRLRSILRGNAVRDHNVILITGLKALLEGIIKGMTSLRTSLCLIGLQFAKDLCTVLGPGADQFVEQLLGTLVKLTGATKKIQAQAANVTTNVLLVSVSYHARLLQHLSLAIQDKNVTPRLYSTSWLRLVLEAHGDSKSQIEHAGIDSLDKSIRKGLADANPGVREGMRLTYWKYASIWPDKANSIMSSLDGTAKKQLEKANPTAVAVGDTNHTEPATRPSHARGVSTSRPAIKTLVQMERARASQPSIDMIALPKTAPAAVPETGRSEQKSSLSSGPQRQGLGGAVRPVVAVKKPVATRVEDTLRSSIRSTSSQTAANPTNASPLRTEQMFSPRRRKPITEQLESENWKTRVEGVITLACLLANKEPPNTDGQKISLPTTETLAPILRKLMADSQAEVVDHLMAPEVIAEIAKIIEWDCILPRVLLMAETDESEVGHDVKSDCLPAVKKMFAPAAAVHQCLDTLALLKVAGHLGKPIKPNFRFTTVQKRPIIKAVLIWLTELIHDHQAAVDRGDEGNSAFSETSEYKLVMNRTMSMMTNIQPSSMNYSPLATFLKALRRSDEPTFDKNLDTFEKPVIIALKKAWGEKPVEEIDGIDEPIADVQSVLGAVPEVLPMAAVDLPVSISPETSMEGSLSLPTTPSHHPAIDVSVYGSNSSRTNEHEDMTMLPSMFAPKTPAGFRQALHMVDSPWSSNGSPTKVVEDSKNHIDSLKLEKLDLGQHKDGKENINVFQDASKFAGTDIWYRKQMRAQSIATPLPKSAQDKMELIDVLIARLNQDDLDAPGYRKLIKIVREHPTMKTLDNSSEAPDIWQAGVTIDHLIRASLNSLNTKKIDSDLDVQCILLLRSCLTNQMQYFAGHEHETISCILTIRNTTNSKSLAAGLEEFALELISAVEAKTGIITILQSLQTYVVDNEEIWKTRQLPSLQLALKALAIAVSQLNIKELEGFAQALSQLIVKALNDEFVGPDIEIAEVRRNTVNLCMAMYSVIGDTRTVLTLLRDLKPSQQNLLTYYFANKSSER